MQCVFPISYKIGHSVVFYNIKTQKIKHAYAMLSFTLSTCSIVYNVYLSCIYLVKFKTTSSYEHFSKCLIKPFNTPLNQYVCSIHIMFANYTGT